MSIYQRNGLQPPAESFSAYKVAKGETEYTRHMDNLLGHRIDNMVYAKEGRGFNRSHLWPSSIVEILYSTDPTAASLARFLKHLTPEHDNRKIYLRDISTPEEVGAVFDAEGKIWCFKTHTLMEGSKTIIQSNTWFVMVDDHDGVDPIDIYIYRAAKRHSTFKPDLCIANNTDKTGFFL